VDRVKEISSKIGASKEALAEVERKRREEERGEEGEGSIERPFSHGVWVWRLFREEFRERWIFG
jgi:hypothetical protein